MDADGEDAQWNDVGARWDALVGPGDDADPSETADTLVNGSRTAAAHEGHPSVDDDGMGWAEDAHGAEFERYKLKNAVTFKRASRIVEEVGPMGELPDYTLTTANGTHVESSSRPESVKANGTDDVDKVPKEADKETPLYTTIPQTSTLFSTSISIPITSTPQNGNAPGSGTSSSDGSLVDKSSVVAATAVLELERGRKRALTPVQGNGRIRDADL